MNPVPTTICRPRGRTVRRRLVRAVVVLSCAAVLGGGWLGIQVSQVHDHLAAAARLVQQLRQQVEHADMAGARDTLARLQHETAAARADTEGVAWRAGSTVPWIGRSLAAVATAATALDEVARRAAPQLVDVAEKLGPRVLVPSGGRMDLAGWQKAAPKLAAASTAVAQARDRAAAIRPADLLPPLRPAIAELVRGLDRAAAVTAAAARAARLLPPMLGAHGPRTYLVLFQNPAEVRATGGMCGAFVVIRAEAGRATLLEQGTAAANLKTFDTPVLPLDPAMRALYTDRLGTYPADVNFTPHFPTAAALARQMYHRRTGRTVDGVLATDPVALSYLLRATGPVQLPGGDALTADNAVRTLLSDTYVRFSPGEQDRYFASAARATFDLLSQGRADPAAALGAVARATGERRILLWSAHADEQAAIEGTMLGGVLPVRDTQGPTVGVFLNDGSGAKLDYYLTQAADLGIDACRPDGRRELRLRVTLGSTAPRSGLPPSVLGMGLAGDPYTIRTNVLIFSPPGGAVRDALVDGEAVPLGTGGERGRAVGVLAVDVKPGESRTVQVTLVTGVLPDADAPAVVPELWTTPTVTGWQINHGLPHKC